MNCDIGVIGLGVMGRSIAMNFINNGLNTAVYNRSQNKVDDFTEKLDAGQRYCGVSSLQDFVASLKAPRKILLMVSAGEAVDSMLDQLISHVSEDDIIIDGGNSWYLDTERRVEKARLQGVSFVGMGVSGGEQGALLGPSMMPGGDEDAVRLLLPILEKVAAKAPDPCVGYVGKGGSGHFVKMVHNGIEYAEMQLISEVYSFATQALDMDRADIISLFDKLNSGELKSYLLEITKSILAKDDIHTSSPLLDMISDKAKGKGTGMWTVESALSQGVSFPSVFSAVDARNLSSMGHERKKVQELFAEKRPKLTLGNAEDCICKAMIAGKLIIYTQGISLIESISKEQGYSINIPDLIRSWRGGCIIRAELLDSLASSYESENNSLYITHPPFVTSIREGVSDLRKLAQLALTAGVPAPCINSLVSYFDSLRSNRLGTALVQAQRDFFGAHTYERIDMDGSHHTEWE